MPPAPLPPVAIRLEQVRQACTRAGLTTNTALAAALGVDASTVGRVLAGQTEPSSRFVFALAHVLEVHPDELFTQTQK